MTMANTTAIQSAKNQPNDPFGYSCYTLVIPVSDELTAQIDSLRQEVGVTVAAIPAHVTVKGTFFGIDSLDDVKQRTASITSNVAPFFVSFQETEFMWWADGGALGIQVTPEAQALHDALVASIAPLGIPAYQDDPYRVHMSFVYGVSPEGLEQTKKLVSQMDFGPGFRAEAVDLMGRIGQAVNGKWTLIQRFPLQGMTETEFFTR
jgi:2'-5' RNA ligase